MLITGGDSDTILQWAALDRPNGTMQPGDTRWYSGKVILSSQLNLVRSHQIQMGSGFYSSSSFFPNAKRNKTKDLSVLMPSQIKMNDNNSPTQQTTQLIGSFLPHVEFSKFRILLKCLFSSCYKMFPGKHFTLWPWDNQIDTRVIFKNLFKSYHCTWFSVLLPASIFLFFLPALGPFPGSQENERNHCDQAGMHENHTTPHRGQGTDPTTLSLCLSPPLPSSHMATLHHPLSPRSVLPLLPGQREHSYISWGHDVRPGRKCCLWGNSKIVWLH